MSPLTITQVFASSIPPSKLFKTYTTDAEKLLPKIAPHIIHSSQNLQGQGEPGTITLVTYSNGTYLKIRTDAIDEESLIHEYTFIEGELLKENNLEWMAHEVKLASTVDGKCQGTSTVTFNPKPGFHIIEEKATEITLKGKPLFDAVESYLLANP